MLITPHRSNDMKTPIKKFTPDFNNNIEQIKRFGSIACMKVK